MKLNHFQSENGAALLITLSIMTLLFMVALCAVDRSDTNVDMSYNQVHEEQAFYVAEAGAKRAFFQLNESNEWRDGYYREEYGDGNYTVTIKDSISEPALLDTIVINSVGEVNGAKATIVIEAAPRVYNPFRYALYADELVDMRNSFTTDSYNSDSGTYFSTLTNSDGDVGSNGIVDANNGTTVGGDAVTSDSTGLIINPGATIYGDTSSTAPENYLEPISSDEFAWAETNSDALTGLSGSYSYNPANDEFSSTGSVTFTSGVYYFTSFILYNSAELIIPPNEEVIIYVEGDIEIKNSGDINSGGDPDQLQIYSSGDIVLKNSGTLSGLFYSPDGEAELKNSSDFYGSVVANDILAHNGAGFHYDRTLSEITRKSTEFYDKASWGEEY